MRGQLDCLEFTLVPASRPGSLWLEMTGSLHRFAHEGPNWGRFGFAEVCETIAAVEEITGITADRWRVSQMEAGVNLHAPPFPAAELLESLIGYGGKEFSPMKTSGGRYIGRIAELTETDAKIYSKTSQYRLPFDIARYEIRARCHVQRLFGISTLADLLEPNKLVRIGPYLTTQARQIIFAEPLVETRFSARDIRIVEAAANPRLYKHLSKQEVYHYRRLVDRYGLRHYAENLSAAVADEWSSLLAN